MCVVNICWIELNHLWLLFLFLSISSTISCSSILFLQFIPSSLFHCLFPGFRFSLFFHYFFLPIFSGPWSPASASAPAGNVSLPSTSRSPLSAPGTSWPYYVISCLLDYLCLIKHALLNIILLIFCIDWVLECCSLCWVVALTKSARSCTWHLFLVACPHLDFFYFQLFTYDT